MCWVGRRGGESFQPEAGFLGGVVAELVGVDVLVRRADVGGDAADGVLNGDAGDGGGHEQAHEVEGVLGELGVAEAAGGPVHAAGAEVGAGRVGDEEVPAVVQDVANVALVVGAGDIGGEDVAGHGVVSESAEGVPDGTGGFAGDEDFHGWVS